MDQRASSGSSGGIAVALSGGGHRASLFGLGVLSYLVDADKNRNVTSISSVSGGSLTNGYLAQAGDYSRLSSSAFERLVSRPLARRLASNGTLWASCITWIYIVVLAVTFVAALSTWFLPLGSVARLFVFAMAVLGWISLLASRRGDVCGIAFRTQLFSDKGRATSLGEIQQSNVQHVFCATDLHAGEHVYFSGGFVCSYRLGWGRPADLGLHVAVQASAALPGAFPPRWLRTARHGFQDGEQETPFFMVLSDGGVYDNMADQWPVGIHSRRQRWPSRSSELRVPTELVVVNASGPSGWTSVWRLGLPGAGEIFSMARVIRVLYEKTTTTRRISLVDRFDRAARDGTGLKGALIMINRSPFWVPNYYLERDSAWPGRAERAHKVIEALGEDNRERWEQIATSNTRVRTTLSHLGTETAAYLLYHGYVLAMANLHVILGYPLLPVPSIDRFRSIVR